MIIISAATLCALCASLGFLAGMLYFSLFKPLPKKPDLRSLYHCAAEGDMYCNHPWKCDAQ